MASFQAKIGWKMPRKIEYKKYRSVSILLDRKFQKNSKKILKLKKKPLWHHFQPKQVGTGRERVKIKNYCSVKFLPNA